jgi:hypothetical protein
MLDELDIVRAMMAVNGEGTASSPTLETTHPSVQAALSALRRLNTEFQSRGFWFNRERDIKLLPDIDGKITIPAETLSFSVTAYDLMRKTPYSQQQYVNRGVKVYDNLNHTYVIGVPIWADLILELTVEELPATAAAYLKNLAVQQFYEDDDGDLNKARKLEERTAKAWHRVYAEELKVTAANALSSPQAQTLRYRIGQSGSPSNPNYPGGR